ncbi:Chromosome partition protein Smc [Carpediemonas membranifera]|uniref:Chromosome partition protein Smc n=1 Tax=Carpediemonas membranifera TaxID=201153 RepID=A0A8J6E2I4_9EUKA|nr:Chromosome partition protein Smc [Carpediemonas membranifera]|eukprot:KAG9394733.1 Chromosome partition protein Smc [Carpediemonas membranifera]
MSNIITPAITTENFSLQENFIDIDMDRTTGPEWKNIQDIVRSSFSTVFDRLNAQEHNFENLEAQVDEKASKKSITIALHRKINKTDVDTILADRPTIADVNRILANKPDVDAVNQALSERPTKRDITEYVENLVNDLRKDVQEQMNLALDEIRANITTVTTTLSQEMVNMSASIAKKADESMFDTQNTVNDRLSRMITDNSSKINSTQANLQSLSGRIQGVLQEQSQAISTQSSDLTTLRAELNRVDQAKAEVTHIEQHRESASEKHSNLAKRMSDLAYKVSTQEEEISSLNAELSRLNATKASNSAIEELRSTFSDRTTNIQEKVSEVSYQMNTVATEKVSTEAIEALREELEKKVDIKDACALFDTKSNVDDVNAALEEVSRTLDRKAEAEQVRQALERQGAINDSLSSEHAMGRWIWKSGRVKSNNVIPWNVQAINTAPDNFSWVKDRSVITIRTGGLYELSCGFFGGRKASVQCLVNGDPVFTTSGAGASTVYHPPRSKLTGSITGLTHGDYISLPPNAKVQLTFTQSSESGAEGFLTLKKL